MSDFIDSQEFVGYGCVLRNMPYFHSPAMFKPVWEWIKFYKLHFIWKMEQTKRNYE